MVSPPWALADGSYLGVASCGVARCRCGVAALGVAALRSCGVGRWRWALSVGFALTRRARTRTSHLPWPVHPGTRAAARGRRATRPRAVASVAKGEEMAREVAVRTNDRQVVRGSVVVDVPSPFGLQAGNRRIERRQLVHQLADLRHEQLLARPAGDRRPVGPGHQDAIVLQPAHQVRRHVSVAQRRRSLAGLTPHRRRQRLRDRRVRQDRARNAASTRASRRAARRSRSRPRRPSPIPSR